MIDDIVERGILKYRSMIANISVAYADLDPEVKITLTFSSLPPVQWSIPSLPNEYRFLDTEFPRIQLEAHEPGSSLDHSFICE